MNVPNHIRQWQREARYIYLVFALLALIPLILRAFAIRETYRPVRDQFGGWVDLGPIDTGWQWYGIALVVGFVAIYVWCLWQVFYGDLSRAATVSTSTRWSLRLALIGLFALMLFVPTDERFILWTAVPAYLAAIFALTAEAGRAYPAVVQSIAISVALGVAFGFTGELLEPMIWALLFGVLMAGFAMNRNVIDELILERARVGDRAATDERFRIARDLHDTVGHSMTQITLKAELARRVWRSDADRSLRELGEIEELARGLSRDVRAAVSGAAELRFVEEVDRSAQLLESSDITPTVTLADITLPDMADSVLAWCLREAVMNVIKHSGANRCDIVLQSSGDQVMLVVSDNGSQVVATSQGGQGMIGMTTRANALGGEVTFRITTSGHTLRVSVPL